MSAIKTYDSEYDCAICYTAMHSTDQTLSGHRTNQTLSHIFHQSCLHQWLQYSTQCPTCRAPILDGNRVTVLSQRVQGRLPHIESLCDAARQGSIEKLKLALTQLNDLSDGERGMAALSAAEAGHFNAFQMILNNGAVTDAFRWEILKEAIIHENSDIVIALLSHGQTDLRIIQRAQNYVEKQWIIELSINQQHIIATLFLYRTEVLMNHF